MADQGEKNPKPLNVRQRRVAQTLRGWVTRSGRRQKDLADELDWSVGKLNNILNAKTAAGPEHIVAIAYKCGVPESEWQVAWNLALAGARGDVWWRTYTTGTVPDFFQDFLETERDATDVRNVEGMLIPGLLQTDDYARDMVSAWLPEPDETIIRERLNLRRKRQARLDDADHPLRLHAVVSESALWTGVGGPGVMIAQLDQLAERAARPNITVQVLPTEVGAYPGFGSSFHLLRFADGETEAAYIEHLESGLYVEEQKDVKVYTLNFERLSRMALNPEASLRRINDVRRKREREGRQGD